MYKSVQSMEAHLRTYRKVENAFDGLGPTQTPDICQCQQEVGGVVESDWLQQVKGKLFQFLKCVFSPKTTENWLSFTSKIINSVCFRSCFKACPITV